MSFGARSALYDACLCGNVEIVILLLSREEIDINLGDKVPLHGACVSQNVEIIQMLLKRKEINVNKGKNDVFPLREVCRVGNMKILKLFLKRKDVNINGDIGRGSPLSDACKNGQIEIVKELLKRKEIIINDGLSLKSAIEKENFELSKILLERKDIKLDSNPEDGGILSIACNCKNDTSIAKMILKMKGVDKVINKISEESFSFPLYNTCVSLLELLLEQKNININEITCSYELTALQGACKVGNLRIVEMLLSKKETDVNYGSETEIGSPIYCSSNNNHVKIVKTLLKRSDINVNIGNGTNSTPLSAVLFFEDNTSNEETKKKFEIFKILMKRKDLNIEKNFNLNVLKEYGGSLMYYLCCKGRASWISEFFTRKNGINEQIQLKKEFSRFQLMFNKLKEKSLSKK